MAASYEAHIRFLLAEHGISVKRRGANRDGNIFLEWGGSANDEAQVQGTFTITVLQHYKRDASILLGRIWRVLWESSTTIPLAVIGDEPIPAGDDGFIQVATIIGDTTNQWWDTEVIAALAG